MIDQKQLDDADRIARIGNLNTAIHFLSGKVLRSPVWSNFCEHSFDLEKSVLFYLGRNTIRAKI